MKQFFLISILLLTFNIAKAQKIHTVDYENQADVKVFVVEYESQCDLKVYKVEYESQVNSSGLSNTMGSTVSGAQAGASIAGPLGAVVGGAAGLVTGLFGLGSSKRKLQKRLHDARQLTSRTNTFNRSGAMSTGLQNEYYQDYGNTQDDVLYS